MTRYAVFLAMLCCLAQPGCASSAAVGEQARCGERTTYVFVPPTSASDTGRVQRVELSGSCASPAQQPGATMASEGCGTRETSIYVPEISSRTAGQVRRVTVPASCPVTGGLARLTTFIEANAPPLRADCDAVLARGRQESPTHFWVHEMVLPDDTPFTLEDFRPREVAAGTPPPYIRGQFSLYMMTNFGGNSGPYSLDELECWSQRGDQLAAMTAYHYGYLSQPMTFTEDERVHFWAAGSGAERQIAAFGIHLLRAARDTELVCDIFSVAAMNEAPECSSMGMLAVTAHGVAEAHYTFFEILENSEQFADRADALDRLRLAAEAGHGFAWWDYYNRVRPADAMQILPPPPAH